MCDRQRMGQNQNITQKSDISMIANAVYFLSAPLM